MANSHASEVAHGRLGQRRSGGAFEQGKFQQGAFQQKKRGPAQGGPLIPVGTRSGSLRKRGHDD
ncbi:hypothetical protein TRM7557_02042 [Tritonibacter multivorans]|uniref:Uncharacterized protein n=1 Tax=Tritonibacter multivorans TaxID=928856 RepID=A0A0P1GBI0_9RHOB|nr:hypothetical protein TRM7557_02042 [Tritonibacter multivorans]